MRSSRTGGIGIVDFKKDGGGPGPPMDERVDPETVIRDAARGRTRLASTETFLRYQYMLVFSTRRRGGTGGHARIRAVLSPHHAAIDSELERILSRRSGGESVQRRDGLHGPRAVEAGARRPHAPVRGAVRRRRPARAVPAAAAIELVHASSLILDDLPAMDDAPLRRGRRANHLEFGEAIAILAAFGLLNLAYGALARAYEAPLATRTVGAAVGRGRASTG